LKSFWYLIICYNYLTCSIICGVMGRVLSSNLVDHGIAPGLGQTIKLVFVASSLNTHSRDTDWLMHNQNKIKCIMVEQYATVA
jgi:hypothetical protein